MSVWVPILEMDTGTGEHTCYSRPTGNKEYIWVTRMADGCWQVEVREPDGEFISLCKSKSLRGAKQRALRFIKDKKQFCSQLQKAEPAMGG